MRVIIRNCINAAIAACLLLFIISQFSIGKSYRRALSINLGAGNCEWTEAAPLGRDKESSGVLLAAFPGSGTRLFWQHAEGLTGIQVGDDFMLAPDGNDRTGIIKTQYPNIEGIWSWGEKMDQVILLIRNPRWAIASYHTVLYEIHYAHDWQTAYKYYNRLFSMRPPQSAWIRWRDYKFDDEVYLWKEFIHYWMEGGRQYWMDWDYERNGQWPFKWLEKDEMKTDVHCIYQMDCIPKAVVAYELLRDPITGPDEANKVAQVVEGKFGLTVIDEEARACVYHETERLKKFPDMEDRDHPGGVFQQDYTFTVWQMHEILEAVIEMRDIYSSERWINNPLAQDLVTNFNSYIPEIDAEIQEMEANRVPTPAPHAGYHDELVAWYNSIGHGDRYNKAKVETLNTAMFALIQHLYCDETVDGHNCTTGS